MLEDEVIETSDVEELELEYEDECEFIALPRAQDYPPATPQRKYDTLEGSTSVFNTHPRSVSCSEDGRPSPRKRMRIDVTATPHGENAFKNSRWENLTLFKSQPSPSLSSTPLDEADPQNSIHAPTPHSSLPPSEPDDIYIFDTPHSPIEENSLSSSPTRSQSQDPLLLSTLRDYDATNATPQRHSSRQAVETNRSNTPSRMARSLFTPSSNYSLNSSPLTIPPSSPMPISSSLASLTTLMSTQRVSNERPSSLDIADEGGSDPQMIPPLPLGLHDGRYSLRTRQAKQLNPYAYDKLLYKHQMRSNPDAIVKVVSPSRGARDTSHVPPTEPTQEEWTANQDVPSDDSSSRGRANRGASRSDENVQVNSAMEAADSSWQRAFLRGLSSDEDDDEARKLIRDERRAREKREKEKGATKKQAKTRRLKAFPLRPTNDNDAITNHPASPIPSHPSRSMPAFTSSHNAGRFRRPSSSYGSDPWLQSENATSSKVRLEDLAREPDRHAGEDGEDIQFNGHDDAGDAMGSDDITFLVSPSSVKSRSAGGSPRGHSPRQSRRSTPQLSEVSSNTESSDDMGDEDRKRFRVLQRMMPAAMINRMLGKPKIQPVSKPRQDSEEGPLLPGKARVRFGNRSSTLDIRGDSESSDIEPLPSPPRGAAYSRRSSGSDSEVEIVEMGHRDANDDAEASSSADEVFSSDDNVNDDTISEWLTGGTLMTHSRPRREENLIDWMLSRTRAVGGTKIAKRRPKPKAMRLHNSRPSKGFQTRLTSYANAAHKTKRPGGLRSEGHSLATGTTKQNTYTSISRSSAGRQSKLTGNDSTKRSSQDIYAKDTAVKPKKTRRPEVRGHLYVVPEDGTRITSHYRDNNHQPQVSEHESPPYQEAEELDRPESTISELDFDVRPPPKRQKQPIVVTHGVHDTTIQRSILEFAVPTSRLSRRIPVDLDIHPFTSGIAFNPTTYIGRGFLHQFISVISGQGQIAVPTTHVFEEMELGPATTTSSFTLLLALVCDSIIQLVGNYGDIDGLETPKDLENIMRAICHFTSWFPTTANQEECDGFAVPLQETMQSLTFRLDELPLSAVLLHAYWFAIEVSFRLKFALKKRGCWNSCNNIDPHDYPVRLSRRLLSFGLAPTLDSIDDVPGGLNSSSTTQHSVESWICLLHLMCTTSQDTQGHPFWNVIHQILQSDHKPPQISLTRSEHIWHSIFSLSALSQFSVHGLTTSLCRLPASWDLVLLALKQIRLTADPQSDNNLSKRSLHSRDEYIRLIISRCFLLWSRWQWRLDDGLAVFNRLIDVFKSRKFANLLRERPDFPTFMLQHDLGLLSKSNRGESAFELFLKLIVQAAQAHPHGDEAARHMKSSQVKKLLQLAIPVGSVPFTKSQPPSAHELSMLYNRFSALVVAIHLDPAVVSLKRRLAQARRYVNFKEADDTTRLACIRGMMHFAIMLRHHHLPLDDLLAWLSEMCNILLSEYKENDAPANKDGKHQRTNIIRDRIVLAIQLLLGSVRRIIETPSMDSTLKPAEYPDPALIEGPWVTEIFATQTNLASLPKTGEEIRRLVQSFLDARKLAVPGAQSAAPAANIESQESQDEYGQLAFDWDDPELLAAFGDVAGTSVVVDIKGKEDAVYKIINDHISPAIYRLVCKHFSDVSAPSFEDHCRAADLWIDCWVGCASVLVHSKKRDWSLYMKLGPQSWERIIEPAWRRRVGLRFSFALLQHDRNAYKSLKNHFVEVLLESIASAKVTLEHEYMALLFSIDKLNHPLLRELDVSDLPEDYKMTKIQFKTMRLRVLNGVFSNLAQRLRPNPNSWSMKAENETFVGFLVTLLTTMHEIYQNHAGEDGYSNFCRGVMQSLFRYRELESHPRLVQWVNWGRTLTVAEDGQQLVRDNLYL